MNAPTNIEQHASVKKRARRDYRDPFGRRVVSVTTVIDGWGAKTRGLMRWAHACGLRGEDMERARMDAMNSGTAAHSLLEADITGTEPRVFTNYPEELIADGRRSLEAFRSWRTGHTLAHVSSEQPLVHPAGFGGTYDHVVMLDGVRTMADVKTATSVYPEMTIQLAAYKELWDHHHPDEPIEQGAIFHAPDGNFRCVLVPLDKLAMGKVFFTNLLFIHKNKKNVEIDDAEDEGGW